KRDVVGALAEGGNLLRRARFLLAEVVAREPEDRKPLVLQLAVQRLETFVLRRVSAIARHVDDQRHLAAEVAEIGGLAEERLRLQVIERRWAGCTGGRGQHDNGRGESEKLHAHATIIAETRSSAVHFFRRIKNPGGLYASNRPRDRCGVYGSPLRAIRRVLPHHSHV